MQKSIIAATMAATIQAELVWDKPVTHVLVGASYSNPQRLCHDLHEYQNGMRTNPTSKVSDVEAIENSFTNSNPKISVKNG